MSKSLNFLHTGQPRAKVLSYNNFGTVLQTMADVSHQTAKMKKKKVKNSDAISPNGDFSSELAERMWSVITFDAATASGLTFGEAVELRNKLEAEKVSGLCIITDEAAARMNADKK